MTVAQDLTGFDSWHTIWKQSEHALTEQEGAAELLSFGRDKIASYEPVIVQKFVESYHVNELRGIQEEKTVQEWQLTEDLSQWSLSRLLDKWESHCSSHIELLGFTKRDANLISQRVFYGIFIAHAKMREDPSLLTQTVEQQLSTIFKPEVEEKIIQRVAREFELASHVGSDEWIKKGMQRIMDITKAWELDVISWYNHVCLQV